MHCSTSIQHLQQENQTSAAKPCPACGCDTPRASRSAYRLNIVLEKPPSIHYASARCGGCDCFRSWVPKPETVKRQQDQRQTIKRLLGNPHLSNWERSFCQGLKACKKLSPKQAEILSRMAAERAGGAL